MNTTVIITRAGLTLHYSNRRGRAVVVPALRLDTPRKKQDLRTANTNILTSRLRPAPRTDRYFRHCSRLYHSTGPLTAVVLAAAAVIPDELGLS